MGGVWTLAWRSVTHHRVRSSLLAAAFGLVLLFPFAVSTLVTVYGAAMTARADATPLVLGAPGSRFDLVLSCLWFRGRVPAPLPFSEALALRDGGLAAPVPMVLGQTAQDFPLVGTTPDYFARRALRVAHGGPATWAGEAVLGADVAATLGVVAGGVVLTDRGSLYDLSLGYPLRLRVTGVLAPSGTPDDRAVFTSLETAWIVAGVGHGHVAAEEANEDERIFDAEAAGEVVLDSSIVEYTEITAENRDSFHFHGDSGARPVSAVLVWPKDDKSRTLLLGRDRVAESTQLLVPREVVDELLGFVLKVKRFFDANTVLVLSATGLFLVLILLLTVRARRRELDTLAKIGTGRGTIAAILVTEFAIALAAGLVIAAAGAALAARFVTT